MKRFIATGLDGKQVVRLLPETDADVEELRRMARSRQLDDRESLGDDRPAPPTRNRHRHRRRKS